MVRKKAIYTAYIVCVACVMSAVSCFAADAKLLMSPEELSWLREKHTVKVRIGSSPPITITDGKVRGIAIDYLEHIFNSNGIKFQYIRDSEVTWPEALEYIKRHEVVDMVPTAKITHERKKDMLFTDEYINAPWVIFTRTDADFVSSIEDLKGRKVSVEEGYAIHEKLKKEYPAINLKVVSAKLEKFAEIPIKNLSTGLVDAYIGNLLSTTYLIQANGYTNVKVAAPTPFDNHNQAMAIRDDWPELVSIINKTLSSMTPEEHAAIRNRWLSIRYEYGIDKVYVAKLFFGILVFAALFIGLVLFWNRRLKTEVTFRKKIEKNLSESESRYRAFFENGPDGIVILDPETARMIEFNDQACRQLGYSRAEFAQLHLADIEINETAEESQKHIRKIVEKGYGDFETLQRRKQGEIRHVQITAQVINAAGKNVFFCIWRDITEKVKTVEALIKSEDKFRSLYENAPLSYQSLDEYGNFLTVNDTWLQVLGYQRDEVIGKNFSDFLHPDWKGHFLENFHRFKAVGEVLGVEFEMMKKNGNMILVSFHGKIAHRADGSFLQTHCMLSDITEERKYLRDKESLENQLHQAQKIESIGQLAGGVAHDFNNMLSIILGYGNMILETIPPDDPRHEYVQEIVNAGTRSATITRQLLAFARKQTIAPKVLNLNETIEEMLKMLRRLIGEDIDLNWHPSSVWSVFIDPSQLDQILANLCVNARDAINGVGKITIETETKSIDETYCLENPGFTPGEFVLLSISDDGIGINSETVDKIFEPFFTTKALGEGTGLGLATVYGIVKQNQGFINVYSEPGQGTTFRIYLPRYTEQVTASEKKKEDVIRQGRGETILVVEDEASILKLTLKILTNVGYVVLIANSPQEAVKLAKENDKTIDLLITDVIMPEMNGRDLANVLLALQPSLKCLFMSGYTSTVIAGKGVLEEGMHFIEKPFAARDLCAKVAAVLKSDRGN